jgi:hypothetical protein
MSRAPENKGEGIGFLLIALPPGCSWAMTSFKINP